MNFTIAKQKQFVTLVAHVTTLASHAAELETQCHCAFIFAKTQDEASIAIVSRLFDLIVIDLDLNGLDLLALAKMSGCINSNTPTIALTDIASNERKKSLVASGFDDYRNKPLTADQLIELTAFWQSSTYLAPFLESIRTMLTKSKNNNQLVSTLYIKLLDMLPKQIDNLEKTIENEEYQSAYEIAHHIHGSLRTCYLNEIAEIGGSLERALIQKNFEFAKGFLSMLKHRVSIFSEHRATILEFIGNGQ